MLNFKFYSDFQEHCRKRDDMSDRVESGPTGHDNFPYLSIWFARTVTDEYVGDWTLNRISVSTESFHHDVRFTDDRLARCSLGREFGAVIDNYLPRSTGALVFTANDFLLEFPAAILRGLRVTAQEVRNGVQRVLLTFRHFLGSVSALFRPGRAPSVLKEAACTLSTRTINDIILPALSLAVAEPKAAARHHDSAQEQLQAVWERLSSKQVELAFYCDLISRFVSSQDSVKSADTVPLEAVDSVHVRNLSHPDTVDI